MARYYDRLETRDPAARRAARMAALPGLIGHARGAAPHYAMLFAAVPGGAPLAALPLTRRADLAARQPAWPPFAGMGAGSGRRVFMAPGPLAGVEGNGPDPWRLARALFAAGVRRGGLLHNSFAAYLAPWAAMAEEGAFALGCRVFPAGPDDVAAQARAAAHLRPDAWCGRPEVLKAVLEAGDGARLRLDSITRALVADGELPPALRQYYAARGIGAMWCWADPVCGLIAYETEAHEGLVVDEGALVEIVRPGTGDPVADGEVGEVVVTLFDTAAPLVRYATGVLSAVLPGRSPCGRTGLRIVGPLGSAEQTVVAGGARIRPEDVVALARAFPEAGRARLVVARGAGTDTLTLRIEVADAAVAGAISARLHVVLGGVSGAVEVVPPGTLPNDGRVIEDTRPAAA